MEYISHSEAETEAFGERLAAALSPGAVVAYRGGLGMGKTAFTRGLAQAGISRRHDNAANFHRITSVPCCYLLLSIFTDAPPGHTPPRRYTLHPHYKQRLCPLSSHPLKGT